MGIGVDMVEHGLMVDIVLPVIYEESSSMWQSSADGWVTTTLLDAGVGLRDVWETVAGLYERVSHLVVCQRREEKADD